MRKNERATVRRALEAALSRLDEEARGGEEAASNFSSLSKTGDEIARVILIIAESNSSGDKGTAHPAILAEQAGQRVINHSPGNLDAQATHPGLDRFPLGTTDPHPTAPKACFMEPGRACVSSGACEMRGF